MSKTAKIVTIVAVFLVLIMSSVAFRKSDFKIGERLPNFTLKTLDGEPISLYTTNQKVIILHFWATYCDVCHEEAQDMEIFYRLYKNEGVEILAINIEPGNIENIKKFVEHYNWTFPILLDPDASVAQKYRITGVPETLVLDSSLSLKMKRFIGPVNWMSPQFRSKISGLIEGEY